MFNGKQAVVIADIETVQDESGNRDKVVSHGTLLIASIDFVGIQTMQLGQAQGVNLSYSVEIPRRYFNKEKYCYFDNTLYKIATTTKAKQITNMLLNVTELEDESIKIAIQNWIDRRAANGDL